MSLKQFIGDQIDRLGKKLLSHTRDKDEMSLLALGSMLSKQQYNLASDRFNDFEFRIFSQFGDDGLIQYLVKNLSVSNQTFIEFGVEDYMESNTRFLLMHNNWSGYVLDGSEDNMQKLRKQSWFWKYDLQTKAAFIDKDNINDLLAESGFENIGLLHIDLDGNDYHILQAIDFKKYNPSILILEYNSVFGNQRKISIPYQSDFVRGKAHHSNLYAGASLPALHYLASQRGYAFAGCNLAGNNAYFVKRELLNTKIKEVSLEEGFIDSKFREGRNANGSLTLLRGANRIEPIKGLPVLNVVTGAIEEL